MLIFLILLVVVSGSFFAIHASRDRNRHKGSSNITRIADNSTAVGNTTRSVIYPVVFAIGSLAVLVACAITGC